MNAERMQATLEDLGEVQSIQELEIYEQLLVGEEGGDDPLIQATIRVRRGMLMDSTVILAQYMVELEQLKQEAPAPVQHRSASTRSTNRYRLLSESVDWSTVPQVHAVMAILKSVVQVGGVVDESVIVAAMEANREVLNTKQPCKRIWDYYKGMSDRGLMMHGNIELA